MNKIFRLGWAAKVGLLVVLASLMLGCIPTPQPDASNPIRTVAILPFSNMSNNIDAPMQVREELSRQLTAKFYRVKDLHEIDQTLVDELGITLGEQLEDVELREIASKIQADAFIFGHVSHFDSTIAGVINTNRVAAKMEMVQVGTQQVVWSSYIGAKTDSGQEGLGSLLQLGSAIADANDEEIRWITVQSNQNNNSGGLLGGLISGLAEKMVKSAIGVDFKLETQAMVRHSVATLRNGPGY